MVCEICGWGRAAADGTLASGDGTDTGGRTVRADDQTVGSSTATASEREVGLSVAPVLAGRWSSGTGIPRSERVTVPPVPAVSGEAGGVSGAGARRARLGGGSGVDRVAGGHLIGRKFHVSYSVSGATRLMHRLGFSPQVPARRAAERDEQAVAAWKEATWAEAKRARAACAGYICFEDEAGFTRRPTRRRTWGRRRVTPVVTISGRRSGRLSVAGLITMRPGSRTRLCHRLRTHPAGKGTRRSMGEQDFIALIDGVHQLVRAPIVPVWDRLNTHVSRRMRGTRLRTGMVDGVPAARLLSRPQPRRMGMGPRQAQPRQPSRHGP